MCLVESMASDDMYWFAARLIGGGNYVSNRLDRDGIRSYRTQYAPGILFLRCPLNYTYDLSCEFNRNLFFYLDAERKHPARITEKEMNNFILVTSVPDGIIPLGEVSPEFLQGDRVRVISGPFEGVEGVVKRIKGDRRLIVSMDNLTAVATYYIRPELLEKVEPDNIVGGSEGKKRTCK